MNNSPNPNFYRVRYTLPPLNPPPTERNTLIDAAEYVCLSSILIMSVSIMGVWGLIVFSGVVALWWYR